MRALALAALCACTLALPARASRPIQPRAPEFPAESAWLNARDLSLARLRGKRVVLVSFINTGNLNSLRAIEMLKRWDAGYGLRGLMVIGVHTPLYSYQKDAAALREELKRLGVQFPVVLDNDRSAWKAFANEGWPSFYVIDRHGRIVFDQLGEIGYAELEREFRKALEDLGRELPPSPMVEEDPAREACGEVSPERPAIGGKGPVDLKEAPLSNSVLSINREGELSKIGPWRSEVDSVKYDGANPELLQFMRVIYRGAQAFAILSSPDGKKTRFYLKQDDLFLHAGNAAAAVQFDKEGQSYIDVDRTRLYALTKNSNDDLHVLALLPTRPGAGVFAFQYADRCFPYQP